MKNLKTLILGLAITSALVAPTFLGGVTAKAVTCYCGTSHPFLSNGDTGYSVGRLQDILSSTKIKYKVGKELKVDRIFGDITEAYVRQLQDNAHISNDGMVGPKTWQAIDEMLLLNN